MHRPRSSHVVLPSLPMNETFVKVPREISPVEYIPADVALQDGRKVVLGGSQYEDLGKPQSIDITIVATP